MADDWKSRLKDTSVGRAYQTTRNAVGQAIDQERITYQKARKVLTRKRPRSSKR